MVEIGVARSSSVVEVPEMLLETAITRRQGNAPLILTVPHDGERSFLGDIPLSHNPSSKKRDFAVQMIVEEVYHHMSSLGAAPHTLTQDIHRAFRTRQIINHFDSAVLQTVSEVAATSGRQVLYFDLHGFKNQPDFGTYDLILGTGHRQTVKESTLDYDFASFMQSRGYTVYVPSFSPREGELFGATQARTLVQKVHRLGLPQVYGMQLEIAPHFRSVLAPEKRKNLGRDIGDFLYTFTIRSCQRGESDGVS